MYIISRGNLIRCTICVVFLRTVLLPWLLPSMWGDETDYNNNDNDHGLVFDNDDDTTSGSFLDPPKCNVLPGITNIVQRPIPKTYKLAPTFMMRGWGRNHSDEDAQDEDVFMSLRHPSLSSSVLRVVPGSACEGRDITMRPCCDFLPTRPWAAGGDTYYNFFKAQRRCPAAVPYPSTHVLRRGTIGPQALLAVWNASFVYPCVVFRCGKKVNNNVFTGVGVHTSLGTTLLSPDDAAQRDREREVFLSLLSVAKITDINSTKQSLLPPVSDARRPNNQNEEPNKHQPNVLYLFLDGASQCVAEKELPLFFKSLNKAADDNELLRLQGVRQVPLGDRTMHNAPAMLSGWPPADRWFFTEDASSFNATDAPSKFSRFLDESLFAHFKRAQYLTHVTATNEAVDASAGFMGPWTGHPYVDLEHTHLAAEYKAWRGTVVGVGQRNIIEPAVDDIVSVWRRFRSVPKFSVLYDASAHFPHEEMLRTLDEGLSRLVDTLRRDGHLSNTVVFVMSDHFTHTYQMPRSLTRKKRAELQGGSDAMLGEMWVGRSSPISKEVKHLLKQRRQMASQLGHRLSLSRYHTHYDWFETVKQIATKSSPSNMSSFSRGVSLLSTVLPPSRVCNDLDVPVLRCPYQRRALGRLRDVGTSIQTSLFQYIQTTFESYNRRNWVVRRWCSRFEINHAVLNALQSRGVEVLQADGRVLLRARYATRHAGDFAVLWETQLDVSVGPSSRASDVKRTFRVSSFASVNAKCHRKCRKHFPAEVCAPIQLGSCVCN
eukprot:PhM_4_TR12057/c0_g1_i1/m.33504